MDNGGIEAGTPAIGNLESQYTNLGAVLTQLGQRIPQETSERQRGFTSNTVLAHIKAIFKDRFPETLQQTQVVEGVNPLLQEISSNIDPSKRHDSAPFNQLGRFIVGFPENMINRLGNNLNVETVTRITKIGLGVLKRVKEQVQDYPARAQGDFLNYYIGIAAFIVGEGIPEAVGRAGEKGHEVLTKIEDLSKTLAPSQLKDLVEYYQNFQELSPQDQARIRRFEDKLRKQEIQVGTIKSPFNVADRESWRNIRNMGVERRLPSWEDLGDMVRSTEEDGMEYGIVVSKIPDGRDLPWVQYLRGSKESIHNGDNNTPSREAVFLHTHPSPTTDRELTAPLISRGDITANVMTDYGGGYLNVVCVDGMSLHIGSSLLEPEQVKALNKSGGDYIVESGEFKGSIIANPKGTVKETEMMKKLKEAGLPYVYSIYEEFTQMKYYFVHLPWAYIDSSVNLYSLCFADGLAQLLSGINGLPDVSKAQNLRQAMINSQDTRRRSFDRRKNRR